ncbi:hypothetical protein IJ114_00005, partial [Candidatus Saccharibacteria bacterium]|nr:hypothetical protein [Candidatus Saccharibacteria bacterium]
KDGLRINGWALTQSDAEAKTENPSATTTNPTYSAGQTVGVTDLLLAAIDAGQAVEQDEAVNLYAIWGEDVLYMQTWNGCSSLATDSVITLTDKRDGNEYHIKKLADQKCWMVQNLRLINKTLTPEDSNVSSSFTVPTSTPAGSSWCTTGSSDCDDQPLAYYDASTRSSYGALYNWYTATAGTGTYNTSSGTIYSSICPKGWRLPTGGASGEFAALDIVWGGTGSNRTGANTYSTFTGAYAEGNNGGFDLAGYINGSSLSNVGTVGNWWSSTAYSNIYAYSLYLLSSTTYVGPQNYNSKYNGFSVRCVASS